MNPRPKSVQPLENYKIIITFQNGEIKQFDVSPLMQYKIYERLKDKSYFKLAKTDGMCVFWDDEIDLCPDLLYEKSEPV